MSLIHDIAALAPCETTPRHISATACQTDGKRTSSRLDVATYLSAHGIQFREKRIDGGVAYILERCPFDAAHGANAESAIVQADDGKLTYHCKHESCKDRRWPDARDAIGAPDPMHWVRSGQTTTEQTLVQAITAIQPVRVRQLVQDYPRMRRSVIDGLVRIGETANVISDPKIGKSWLSYGLDLSVASGRKWLETFATKRGRVLHIDNELHPETIAHRIPVVADAMGIPSDEYHDAIDVVCLRGALASYADLGPRLIDHVGAKEYILITIDAHYRMLGDMSENDNAAMAGIFNLIDQYAAQTQAAWILIHHTSKGSQAEKAITDIGAGAGSQSRAADTHMVLRRHEEREHVVLDAEVRSFPPVEPLTIRWTFPIWIPSDADPSRLKGRRTRSEQRQSDSDKQGMLDVIDVLRKWDKDVDGPATPNRITDKSLYGKDKTRNLLAKLLHAGHINRNPMRYKGNETHEYFVCENE